MNINHSGTETPLSDPKLSEVVERDDLNNANLLTFEVTWENGSVEHIKAHHVLHPAGSRLDAYGEHIRLTGWYDGKHRTALSARADRIRSIRDLGVLPPLPDLDPVPSPEQIEFRERLAATPFLTDEAKAEQPSSGES